MDDADEELAAAIRDLAEAIEALQRELDTTPSVGLRPPSTDDVLRVADSVAIPAVLAVLRANVRALETAQRGVRLLRTERAARDRTASALDGVDQQVDRTRRTAVSQLERALRELRRAMSEGSVPTDDGTRELLDEAQRLRDDVDRRLSDVLTPPDRSEDPIDVGVTRIEIDDATSSSSDDPDRHVDERSGPAVDVDAELASLKEQYTEDESGGGNGAEPARRDGVNDASVAGENSEDSTADGEEQQPPENGGGPSAGSDGGGAGRDELDENSGNVSDGPVEDDADDSDENTHDVTDGDRDSKAGDDTASGRR